jgi:RNA polymerase sigma-70 factor, ECF subfamily
MATLAMAGREIVADEFESVVREHQRRIYRVVYLLIRDADEADSITQECFLRAYKRREGFRGESSLSTWLVRIAINLARDHIRSRRESFWRRLLRGKDVETHSVRDRGHTPEDAILERERMDALWAAARDLPVRQRMVFTLRFAEEMPLAEIAAAMNVREGTVKAQIATAIETLKKKLNVSPERTESL